MIKEGSYALERKGNRPSWTIFRKPTLVFADGVNIFRKLTLVFLDVNIFRKLTLVFLDYLQETNLGLPGLSSGN